MVAAIPASAIVNVTPNVIDAGGSGLDLIGLLLTNSIRPPVGTVVPFASLADVGSYFGTLSTEYALASIYFAGYGGSAIKPASLLFYQYPAAAVPAYLRGGSVAALTLSQLQAISTSGTITITIDGRTVTSGAINLSAVTSFSQAATTIQTALNDNDASFTGVIAVTTGILTASAVTGTIAVGQTVTGAGVPAGTVITALGTGTGGAGTYSTNITTAVASTAMKSGPTLVTYDSTSGAFIITAGTPGATGSIGFASSGTATGLKLTSATGAVTSQGGVAGTPGAAMDAVYAQTQNFVSFATAFQPNTTDMLAFAAWNAGKANRFLYAMPDPNSAPTVVPDTTSVGYQIAQLGYGGTVAIYDPANAVSLSAFVMGMVASIDFSRVNARITADFRVGAGLTAGVTSQSIAANLTANGYNFYGRYATANQADQFFSPGQISGEFDWIDSYVNQVWMNNAFQRALMDFLLSVGSVPYNAAGFALIEAALADPINAAINFGAIRAGVALSQAQAAQVNSAAGLIVSDVIQQRGWYLQVAAPTAAVRAARGTPICNFFYTDGESVQTINLASVLIQ